MKNIFEISKEYKEIEKKTEQLTEKEKIALKTLIATDLATDLTMFVTGLSFEELEKVYSLIDKKFVENKVKTNQPPKEEGKKDRVERQDAIDYVINELQKNNPNFHNVSAKYGKVYGSLNGKNVTIQVGLSRDYNKEEKDIVGSWHKLNATKPLSDYYVFVVEDVSSTNEPYKSLLLNQGEFKSLVDKKVVTSHMLNWYFKFYANGKVYDERERNSIDVTLYEATKQKKWKL